MNSNISNDDIDLLITAPRLVCPATGLDGPGVIGVRDGVIEFVEAGPSRPDLPAAHKVLAVDDGVLLPGLADLHAHPALA